MPTMPTWFLAHGAPTHGLPDHPVHRLWADLPRCLPAPPRALLCLSAHWLTPRPTLAGHGAHTAIQHDFYGFPEALYHLRWDLRPDEDTGAWLARRLRELLGTLEEEADRPLDHGVWVPLMSAWPRPPFPVFQLSLGEDEDPEAHWELGRRLAPLRQEGVLLVGSGGLVHNLRRLHWEAPAERPEPWACEFMAALETAILSADRARLLRPHALPHGREAVPTLEHYLPLLITLGAAEGTPVTPLLRRWELGTLALHSYARGP